LNFGFLWSDIKCKPHYGNSIIAFKVVYIRTIAGK